MPGQGALIQTECVLIVEDYDPAVCMFRNPIKGNLIILGGQILIDGQMMVQQTLPVSMVKCGFTKAIPRQAGNRLVVFFDERFCGKIAQFLKIQIVCVCLFYIRENKRDLCFFKCFRELHAFVRNRLPEDTVHMGL